MLDIKFIRENIDRVKEAVVNKNIDLDIDELLQVDDQRKEMQQRLDFLRTQKNELAKSIQGKKPTEEQIAEGKKIRELIVEQETLIKDIDQTYELLMYKVPNVVSEDTPAGQGEEGNKIVRKVGEIPKFDFKIRDHMELGVMHGIIDTEKSAVVSGARFNYLFGEAVMLQFALLQFCFHTLTNKEIIEKIAKSVGNPFTKPFVPVITPVIAKADIMKKMDRFDPIEDRYYLPEDDSLLVGSTEHTLGPIHANEVIDEKDLPIRYIGYSSAFRREAGTYGKDMAGILRRHQFEQSEIETFIQPEHGLVEQDFIVAVQEYLVQQLEIPYQLVLKCTGDIGGKADFRALDIECYMPGQAKYRETHTSDYMTDFQARRLNIRYKNKEGKNILVHMNDATGFAMGRILIAILENYQQEDGSIKVPKVLQPYAGFDIIKKKEV